MSAFLRECRGVRDHEWVRGREEMKDVKEGMREG